MVGKPANSTRRASDSPSSALRAWPMWKEWCVFGWAYSTITRSAFGSPAPEVRAPRQYRVDHPAGKRGGVDQGIQVGLLSLQPDEPERRRDLVGQRACQLRGAVGDAHGLAGPRLGRGRLEADRGAKAPMALKGDRSPLDAVWRRRPQGRQSLADLIRQRA